MKKISQKDIAESLNLSRVTVTKALKDHPDIAVGTIKKVNKRARELGYIPDFIGRSLSSRRTYTLGIIIPKIAHSFFSYSIERIYEAAHKKGYRKIYHFAGPSLLNISTERRKGYEEAMAENKLPSHILNVEMIENNYEPCEQKVFESKLVIRDSA